MSLTQQAASGAGWSTLANIARQFLTLFGLAILAKQLGPGAYGLMATAAIVTGMLANFKDLGTGSAIIQRKTVSAELLSTLFWVNLGLGTILTSAMVVVSVPTAWFFQKPEVAPVLRWLSLSFFFQSAGAVHNALLNREMRFKETAAADLISAVAGYAVAIPMALYGAGVWSLVGANLISPLVATVVYWVALKWRPSFLFSMEELRRVAGFSLNLSGFVFVNYFARNADNIIISRFLGTSSLGIYQMAYNLMTYPVYNVSQTLLQALLPAFSRIQDDNVRLSETYLRTCSLIAVITFPIMAGVAVVAQPFVGTVLGPDWIEVIPIFQILAPVGMLQSVHTAIGVIYVVKGKTSTMLRMGLFSTTVYVVAFLIGVRFGVAGVATAYGLAYALIVMYPTLVVPLKMIDINVGQYFREILPQGAASGIMVVACYVFLRLPWVVTATPWVRLASSVSVGAAVYLGVLRWMRPPVVLYTAELCSQVNFPGKQYVEPRLRRFAGL